MAADPGALSSRLRLEGWRFHQRLAVAAQMAADPQSPSPADPEPLLRAWRQVVAPDTPANFDKRLAWDGLTADQAARAIHPNPCDLPTQPWWLLLEQLRAAARAPLPPGPLERRGASLLFVHVWRPAAAWALQTLRRRCADLEPQLRLGEEAWLDLAEALLARLCSTGEQALWAMFNERRTPGQALQAHVDAGGDGCAEPVRERYDAFVAELLASGYEPLLAAFPVLGRLLAVVTQLWLESKEELLRRLARDRKTLVEHFSIPLDAPLLAIQLGLSDPHRRGRTVAILSFEADGVPRKVVYKPKDMRLDQTYQLILRQLNGASSLPPLRCLTIVCGEGYGWMEWVDHRLCADERELARFYTNAGRTMAVLYLLGCTDCHHENLMACGDQLLLIDTETLLEADPRDHVSADGDDPDALSPLQTSMEGSVLRSGLLPQWQMVGAGRKRAMDISALGIQPPPPEAQQPGWVAINSDGMMFLPIPQPCELPTSLPVGLGSPQRLTEFVEHLCDGFERQLQEAIRLRPLLLRSLEGFRGQPRRLVARATRIYFTIQRQMLEPASLRSAVAHGLKLEQLSRSFVLAAAKPSHWPLFAAELRQMERLDIPFFDHPIDSETLPLPDGLPPIPGFMQRSGLKAARQRLLHLDSADIAFQLRLVRGAIAARHLATTSTTTSDAAGSTAIAGADPGAATVLAPLGPDAFRQEAFRLVDEIWTAAIPDGKGRPEWLGMDLGEDGESFHFGLIGPSLYSGVSGIALCLARRAEGAQTASAELWRQRAWASLEGLAELAERNRQGQWFRFVRDAPLGLSGSGGTLLALGLLRRAGLSPAADLAVRWIDQIQPERLLVDEDLDLISGVTGLIGPLLLSGHPRALELASMCGERLLTMQQRSGAWAHGGQTPPLTGWSHGAAGMAAALARLALATGEQRFAEAARRAVAYERSTFVAAEGNWPDFRQACTPTDFMLSWCHGAPGIMLSHLVLRATGLEDEQTTDDLRAARAATTLALQAAIGQSGHVVHLCCGLFGLSGLLRLEAQISGTALAPIVPLAESAAIQRAQTLGGYPFLRVDSGSLSLPGLFNGKAGVALALMEAASGMLWLPTLLSVGLLVPAPTEPPLAASCC